MKFFGHGSDPEKATAGSEATAVGSRSPTQKANHTTHEDPKYEGKEIVDWDGPHDPENPYVSRKHSLAERALTCLNKIDSTGASRTSGCLLLLHVSCK